MGIFDFFKKYKNIENNNGLNEKYFDPESKGKISERFYLKEGKKDGLYQKFNTHGGLMREIHYNNGKTVLEKIYSLSEIQEITYSEDHQGGYAKCFKNEKLFSEGKWIKKIHDGKYFPYGKQADVIIDNHIFEGDTKTYYPTGELQITSWKNEKPFITTYFNKNGNIEKECTINQKKTKKLAEDYYSSKKYYYESGGLMIEILLRELLPEINYTDKQKSKYRKIDIITFYDKNGKINSISNIKKFFLDQNNRPLINSLYGYRTRHKIYDYETLRMIDDALNSHQTIQQLKEEGIDYPNQEQIDAKSASINKKSSRDKINRLIEEDKKEEKNIIEEKQEINGVIFNMSFDKSDNLISINLSFEDIPEEEIKKAADKFFDEETKNKLKAVISPSFYAEPSGLTPIEDRIRKINKVKDSKNSYVCFKERSSLKYKQLEIYQHLKKDFKKNVVVDISNRKDVVFTSNSYDECKDWINEDLVIVKGKKLNGNNLYKFESGARYIGSWKDGLKHGKGILTAEKSGDYKNVGVWEKGVFINDSKVNCDKTKATNTPKPKKDSSMITKQQLPEWFNGEIYEEGDKVRNKSSGEEYELNAKELSMYDFLKGIQLLQEMETKISPEILNDTKKGLDWFRKNNAEAYIILFK